MARQAMDTFVAVMDDGSDRLVTKGDVFPDGHELVKRDVSGTLFRKLDLGDEPPAKSSPAAAPAAKAAPVKTDPVKAKST